MEWDRMGWMEEGVPSQGYWIIRTELFDGQASTAGSCCSLGEGSTESNFIYSILFILFVDIFILLTHLLIHTSLTYFISFHFCLLS